MFSTHRAFWILFNLDLPEIHRKRFEYKKSVCQEVSYPEEVFDRLHRLEGSDDSGHTPGNPGLAATGNRPHWRWGVEDAAVASTLIRDHRCRLAVEPQYSSMGKWFPQKDAGIVDQELCWEIVCTINDKIIVGNDLPYVR